jgi:regulator of protease activity HflC (stomatin/prohibitin superfamily)
MFSINAFTLIIFFSLFVFVLLICINIFKSLMKRVIIYDYEKGLLYKNGRFHKILESGKYWCNNFQILNTSTGVFINYNKNMDLDSTNVNTFIKKVDLRPSNITINAQEILSNDNISLKITLVIRFEIQDPYKALNKVQNYYEDLYLQSQIVLRDIVGSSKIDYLLENRNEINSKLTEIITPKAQDIGIKIYFVSIKDIIFPGELKQVFAQVIKAQKEGLALLEKSRGETASIRNLVNASKILDENPSLIYLRMLQALGESKGNTLVLGSDFEKLIYKKSKKE